MNTTMIYSLEKGSCKYKFNAVFLNECFLLQMLYFDRIDVSEGIDVNKTSPSKDYDICNYWYF